MKALRSIRLRLLIAALAVTVAALAIAGAGFVTLFGRHIERRIAQDLDVYISQIAAGLEIDASGKLTATVAPTHPRFAQAYGGLYWQVLDESTGDVLRSRSLWDFQPQLPVLDVPDGQSQSGRIAGPEGRPLILREKRLVLALRGANRPVRITLAEDKADADALKSGFARDLVPALAILGLILIAGAWLQVGAGLRPFTAVRRGVGDIRAGRASRLDEDVPAEIAPLVGEVNTLLDMQDASIRRARDRAADLAHGLRTPLTALASDVQKLREDGNAAAASDIEAVAARMRRTVERELARARARHRHGRASVAVEDIVSAIARTIARTPRGGEIRIETGIEDGLTALVDPDDLYDVLGNLMENAARVARGLMRVSGRRDDGFAVLTVENDGDAIDPKEIAALAARGARQDEAGGAGLGLAIVGDVLAAYDSAPDFFASPLGGLGVRFRV